MAKRLTDLAGPALGALALDPLLSLVDTIIVGQQSRWGGGITATAKTQMYRGLVGGCLR